MAESLFKAEFFYFGAKWWRWDSITKLLLALLVEDVSRPPHSTIELLWTVKAFVFLCFSDIHFTEKFMLLYLHQHKGTLVPDEV
jgi:hypothetical protein